MTINMKKLIIVGAQINLMVGDIEANTNRIVQEAKNAVNLYQADIVVFPELAISGYPPEDLIFRSGFNLNCMKAVETICQEMASFETTLIVGHPLQLSEKVYNQVSILQKGRILASYSKQELPNYTVFDEKRYFHTGHKPCVVNINNYLIGVIICEDLWFPNASQQAVAAGAQLIVCINASPFDRNQAQYRETTLIERTQKNSVPFIYINLVGGQDELVFDGGSMVVNAEGRKVLQAPYFQEELFPIEVSALDNQKIIIEQYPIPPTPSLEENLYNALVLGVKDYIKKNHFSGAIIGLSGGIDSALMLVIAADAIGPENVTAVMMPSKYTRAMSLEDAEKQAKLLGTHYHVISIDSIYSAFIQSLAAPFANLPTDTTEENIQARIRGTLLMALSNKTGNIVLATGNKSEMAAGYATLYGDMAGGFAALKDIPKTIIYRLADYRNQQSESIPQRVIDRPPSAELAEDQLDQDTLPPYEILDQIIHLYIELDQSPEMIYATGIDKATVDRIIKMINRNEYKRRQAPVGIRTTTRAFGKDRRYPITSGYARNL